MKKFILPAVFSVVLFSCQSGESNNASSSTSEEVNETVSFKNISVNEAAEIIASTDVVVLDVRSEDEFESGHILDAINMDVNNADFTSLIANLDNSKEYVVYCHSGRRSKKASEILVDNGFTNVKNVKGGMVEWKNAGFQVVQ